MRERSVPAPPRGESRRAAGRQTPLPLQLAVASLSVRRSHTPPPERQRITMRRLFLLITLALGLMALSSCTVTKVVLTPVTVVRDVVDLPLTGITNGFLYFAEQTQIAKAPGANVGWSWTGGFNFGVGYDVSHFLFLGLTGVFGAVDYVVCRSVWPEFPTGISPWRKKGQPWGTLWFPNTRVLWGDRSPIYEAPAEEAAAPAIAPNAVALDAARIRGQ